MWKKLRDYFKEKEKIQISDRYIAGIEIIYSLILACAVVKIVDIIQKDIFTSLKYTWHSLLICILFLLRFFFAPSKNIKILGQNSKGLKWLIIPFDGIILLLHSFMFYYMCVNILDAEIFYKCFFLLLCLNVFWLFSIALRTRQEGTFYNRIWFYNNSACAIFYFAICNYYPSSWEIWFILALLNSVIDLGLTYSDYFK